MLTMRMLCVAAFVLLFVKTVHLDVPNLPDGFCDCIMKVSDRQNCGVSGITRSQCKARGCCYKARPAGSPWCFKKRASAPFDMPGDCSEARDNVTLRVDCGWPNIRERHCKYCQFCCWNVVPHFPYCFHRKR